MKGKLISNIFNQEENYEKGFFDKKTKVLTSKGFKFFKDIKKNEKIAILDDNENIIWLNNFDIKKENKDFLYQIKNNNYNVLVSDAELIFSEENNAFFLKQESNPTKQDGYTFLNFKRTLDINELLKLYSLFLIDGKTELVKIKNNPAIHKVFIKRNQNNKEEREEIIKILKKGDIRYKEMNNHFLLYDRDMFYYFQGIYYKNKKIMPMELIERLDKDGLNILFENFIKKISNKYENYFEIKSDMMAEIQYISQILVLLGYCFELTEEEKKEENGKNKKNKKESIFVLKIYKKRDYYIGIKKEDITQIPYNDIAYKINTNNKILIQRDGLLSWI